MMFTKADRQPKAAGNRSKIHTMQKEKPMKTYKLGACLFFTLALASPTVAAQAQGEDAGLKSCLDAAQDNASMGDCAVAYAKRQEAALTVAWKHAYSLMDGKPAKKTLLDEQRLDQIQG
jgi:uncharacterized protein YecT (DUF1311 family)